MVDLVSNLSPQHFYDKAMNSHIEILRGFWDTSASHGTTTLHSLSISVVLKNFLDSFANAELTDPSELHKRESEIMKCLSLRPGELARFEDLEIAVRNVAKQINYHIFEIIGNINVFNLLGVPLMFRIHELDKDEIIQPGGSRTYERLTPKEHYDSRITLQVEDYKAVSGIETNVHYKKLIPLKPIKRDLRRRNRAKRNTASGFEPCIVLDPSVDKYDNITLAVKSCIRVEARTPIDFRVFRLNLHSVDINGRHILNLLEDHCEYSPIIFDKYGVSVDSSVSLPLAVTNSSYVHGKNILDAFILFFLNV